MVEGLEADWFGGLLTTLSYIHQKCCVLLFLTHLVPHVVHDQARLVAAHRVCQGVPAK